MLAESAPGVALGGLARAKVLQYKHFSGLDREAQGKRLEAWRPESASGVAFLSAVGFAVAPAKSAWWRAPIVPGQVGANMAAMFAESAYFTEKKRGPLSGHFWPDSGPRFFSAQ